VDRVGAARAFVVLGALLFLVVPFSTGFSQWQSFDRPGEDFRALAVSDTVIYALSSPVGLHSSKNDGQTWYALKWRAPIEYQAFCLGILDGVPVGGTSKGGFLRGEDFAYYLPAVPGVEDDIQAVGSTRSGTSSTWYLGGFGRGVRHSTDGGKTWALCNDGLTDLNVASFVTIPAPGDSSQILFAGTYGGGVFRSDDDGLHWTISSSGIADLHVYALIAHGNTLYAAHSGGRVSRSSDTGTTWAAWGTGLPYTDVISLAQISSGEDRYVYAGTIDRGVWRYSKAGGSWEPVNEGLRDLRINSIAVKGNVLFVATDHRIYRSCNLGVSWQLADWGARPSVNSIFAASFSSGEPTTRLFLLTTNHYYFSDLYTDSPDFYFAVC